MSNTVRAISRAETWDAVHKAFTQVNFSAYDFNTIKASLVEYIKTNYVETFNNFIESDELVVFIEAFAYVAELLAYRMDMIGNEGMLSTATGKQMVISLAKHLSYRVSRNMPARGMVKVVGIRTTENVVNQYRTSLSNVKINWNDGQDPLWKDNFMTILHRVLPKYNGTTNIPRTVSDGILTEIHSLNVTTDSMFVYNFTSSINGKQYTFDIVPCGINGGVVEERRPQRVSGPTIIQRSDGFGDSSDSTGFFFMIKQGTLKRTSFVAPGTPNFTFTAPDVNVNELDVWLNEVDSNGNIVNGGDWVPILTDTDNIAFNIEARAKKYEIDTQDKDAIRLVFGDGEFATIPTGNFDVWYRSSANENLVVSPSDISNVPYVIKYYDDNGLEQQLTLYLSLTSAIVNASASESIESIKRNAPKVYGTQGRMVSGYDYNQYPLQDPSIFKLKTINRVFAGASRYSKWSDPTGTYDDVKIFGDDGAVYVNETMVIVPPIDPTVVEQSIVDGSINNIIGGFDFIQKRVLLKHGESAYRTSLSQRERDDIAAYMMRNKYPIFIKFDVLNDVFIPYSSDDGEWLIRIDTQGRGSFPWYLTYKCAQLHIHSDTTKFWNYNVGNVWNYNNAYVGVDSIAILAANINKNRTGTLQNTVAFRVIGQPILDVGTGDRTKPNTNELTLTYNDADSNGVPEYPSEGLLWDICHPSKTISVSSSNWNTQMLIQTEPYLYNRNDVEVVCITTTGATISPTVEPVLGANPYISTAVKVHVPDNTVSMRVTVYEHVYFSRKTVLEPWVVALDQRSAMINFAISVSTGDVGTTFKRHRGRSGLNFLWAHYVRQGNLVDPCHTNIHDMFILTTSQYQGIKQWLNGELLEPPTPTSIELDDTYGGMLRSAMLSDTIVMKPAKFRVLFGAKSNPTERAQFKLVKRSTSTYTDRQLKVAICKLVEEFFNLDGWDFGETFYFTELASYIHASLPDHIETVVLVPTNASNTFGDLFQVNADEHELFIPHITVDDIVIVSGLNRVNMSM